MWWLQHSLEVNGRQEGTNAWLTSWLGATLDLQIVNPALKKAVNSSASRLKDVDTAVVGGLRLYVRF